MKFIVNEDGHIDISLRGLSFKLGIDDLGTKLETGIEVEIDDKILDATLSIVTADAQELLNKQKRSISMRCVTPIKYSWTKESAGQFVFDRIHNAYMEWKKIDLVELITEMQGFSETRSVVKSGSVMFEECDDPELQSALDFLLNMPEFADIASQE